MDNATALAAAADSSDPGTGLRAVAALRTAAGAARGAPGGQRTGPRLVLAGDRGDPRRVPAGRPQEARTPGRRRPPARRVPASAEPRGYRDVRAIHRQGQESRDPGQAKATERGDDQIGPCTCCTGWPPPTAWPPGRWAAWAWTPPRSSASSGRATGRSPGPLAARRPGRGRRGAGGDRHRPGRDQAADRGELRPRSAGARPAHPAGPAQLDRPDADDHPAKMSLALALKEAQGTAPQLHRHRASAAGPAAGGRAEPARPAGRGRRSRLGLDPARPAPGSWTSCASAGVIGSAREQFTQGGRTSR